MVSKNQFAVNNRSIGQIFTPEYVAKFMVKNVLDYMIDAHINIKATKVLEPCAGEGVFLKFLIQRGFYKITAYEIDNRLNQYLSKVYTNIQLRNENFLSSPFNEKYDLIVGNPPYLGHNYNAEVFQEYIKKYPICAKYFVGHMDLFYFFLHIGIEKLAPGGFLTFITTKYWITKSKKTGVKLLKPHIIDDCFLLQYVDLSTLKVFADAKGQHNCIFVLQKKTDQEKQNKVNKKIEIIQIFNDRNFSNTYNDLTHLFSDDLIQKLSSNYALKYSSALTNRDLKRDGSWNLLYPEEVKEIVDKIELNCLRNKNKLYLKDFFFIRNGIIFVKDDIFVLKEGENFEINNETYCVKIGKQYVKLNTYELKKLKKIYKSKSIRSYGYNSSNFIGYAIYFNKQEFGERSAEKRNQLLKEKYPNLTNYLEQFQDNLREILLKDKENPEDFYFPRRGAYIWTHENDLNRELVDLEPYYDKSKKVFIKYISNENQFGFAEGSYYATSDTYFLWPKSTSEEVDYPFLLAYLNSKVVFFIFKAKNIKLKRSKTKLEDELPILNIDNFNSKNKIAIISLIKFLSSYLINFCFIDSDFEKIEKDLIALDCFSLINQKELYEQIVYALKCKNSGIIQETIDKLFFQLLDLNKDEITRLTEKYYNN
jgi:adenine-specific DNA-methyltransferase